MKRFMMLAAVLCLGLAATACTTMGGTSTGPSTGGTGAQGLSPAQVIQIACPPIQSAIVQFEAIDATLGLTNPQALKAGAALAKAQPLVAAACAAGANVSLANVQDFANTVLPAISQVAGTLPLKPAQLQAIQAGLIAAQVAVGVVNVVESQIAAAQTANGAVTAPAATAPQPMYLSPNAPASSSSAH